VSRWVALRIIGVLLVGFLLVGCDSTPQQAPEVLTIGVVAPLEGEYGDLGRSVRNGVVPAAEAWNAAGGALGREIQLVLRDSRCDFLEGRAAAQAVLDEGALFVIGAVCADASEGVAQVVSEAGALQISPASVAAGLTLDADQEVRPLVFRMPVIDVDQGTIAAVFAREVLGAQRVGIVRASGSTYGNTLATAFQVAFEEAGGEVVIQSTYDQNAPTFFEALEPVRDANPDLLYLPGYHTVANLLVAQARSFGLLQPILGSDGWDSHALDLGAVEGAYYPTHFYADEPSTAVRSWVELYEQRYLAVPDAPATLSYDAANMLFTAIQETGSFEPLFVAQTLASLTFEGVSGTTVFSAVHNPVRTMVVVRVEGGRLAYVGRFGLPEAPAPDGD